MSVYDKTLKLPQLKLALVKVAWTGKIVTIASNQQLNQKGAPWL